MQTRVLTSATLALSYERKIDVFSQIKSERKIMFINFRIGEIGRLDWTKGWDHYGALNSDIITELETRYPDAKIEVNLDKLQPYE